MRMRQIRRNSSVKRVDFVNDRRRWIMRTTGHGMYADVSLCCPGHDTNEVCLPGSGLEWTDHKVKWRFSKFIDSAFNSNETDYVITIVNEVRTWSDMYVFSDWGQIRARNAFKNRSMNLWSRHLKLKRYNRSIRQICGVIPWGCWDRPGVSRCPYTVLWIVPSGWDARVWRLNLLTIASSYALYSEQYANVNYCDKKYWDECSEKSETSNNMSRSCGHNQTTFWYSKARQPTGGYVLVLRFSLSVHAHRPFTMIYNEKILAVKWIGTALWTWASEFCQVTRESARMIKWL